MSEQFTLAEIRANLVTLTDIVERFGLGGVSTARSWATRYDDWPEPLHSGARGSQRGRQAVYWWPDVQRFAGRHALPQLSWSGTP